MSLQDIGTSSGNEPHEKPGVVNKPDIEASRLRLLHCQYIRGPLESTGFRQNHRSLLPNVIEIHGIPAAKDRNSI